MKSYEDHPIASCWRLTNKTEHHALTMSIRRSGLLLPIMLYEGKILDGRNRYRACVEAGVAPRFEEYKGDDALQFAIDTICVAQQKAVSFPSTTGVM